MKFSAVILAGGKSSRMGRDKAFLEVDGQPLLARQIQIVRGAGAREVLVSGSAGIDYSQFGCRVVQDRVPGVGPLAGIEASLAISPAPSVLVLAVDMLWMNVRMLRELVSQSAGGCGIIPLVGGEIEPLAAVYPTTARPLVQTMLSSDGSRSARLFAARCVEAGLAAFWDIPGAEADRFHSCNTPSEFQRRFNLAKKPVDC